MGTPSREVETWVKAEPPRSAGYRVGSGQHSGCRVWWAVGASTFRSVRGHPGLAGGVFKYQHTEHRLGCSLEMDFSRLGPGAQPQPLGLTSSQGPASPSSPEQRGCPPWSPEPPEASCSGGGKPWVEGGHWLRLLLLPPSPPLHAPQHSAREQQAAGQHLPSAPEGSLPAAPVSSTQCEAESRGHSQAGPHRHSLHQGKAHLLAPGVGAGVAIWSARVGGCRARQEGAGPAGTGAADWLPGSA